MSLGLTDWDISKGLASTLLCVPVPAPPTPNTCYSKPAQPRPGMVAPCELTHPLTVSISCQGRAVAAKWWSSSWPVTVGHSVCSPPPCDSTTSLYKFPLCPGEIPTAPSWSHTPTGRHNGGLSPPLCSRTLGKKGKPLFCGQLHLFKPPDCPQRREGT